MDDKEIGIEEDDFLVGDELCIHGVWFKISAFAANEEGAAVFLEEVTDFEYDEEVDDPEPEFVQDQHLWEPVSTSATLVEEEETETYWVHGDDVPQDEFAGPLEEFVIGRSEGGEWYQVDPYFFDQHWELVEQTYWLKVGDHSPAELYEIYWRLNTTPYIDHSGDDEWVQINGRLLDQNWRPDTGWFSDEAVASLRRKLTGYAPKEQDREVHTDPYGDHRMSEPYSKAGRWCYTCNRWERFAHHG